MPPTASACTLVNPLPGAELTDGYGCATTRSPARPRLPLRQRPRRPLRHEIYAAAGGTVVTAGEHDSYGNYLIIQHSAALRTLYAHCQTLLVSAGDTVSAGDVVALVGATGEATGPHLHFEVIASAPAFPRLGAVCRRRRMIRFRLKNGTEWQLGADFFGVLCLSWELGGAGGERGPGLLMAVLLHEGGHLLAYLLSGIPLRRVIFDFRGVLIRPEPGFYPFSSELSALLAGSGTSFLWAAAAFILFPPAFWQASFAMGLWSLLPLPGMDGGEVVSLIAGRIWPGCDHGLRLFFIFTRALVTLFIALGCLALQSPLPLFWAACLWM